MKLPTSRPPPRMNPVGTRVGVDTRESASSAGRPVRADHVTENVVALAQTRAAVCADVVLEPNAHPAQGPIGIGSELGVGDVAV